MAAYKGSLTQQATAFIALYETKISECVARLDEDQIWWRPHADANSVGNLVLHLCGNLSLWIRRTLGGREFERHRSEEFAADRSVSRAALLEQFADVVADCRVVLGDFDESGLDRPLHVQRYDTDARGVILHAVEHMSYHTGQIVLVTKQLLGPAHGIEFYPIHKGE